MSEEFSSDVLARGLWQRIARDGYVSQQVDVFWKFRDTRALVPYLLPLMAPPSIALPVAAPTKCPEFRDVKEFLDTVISGCNVPKECCIIALVYIDRLRTILNMKFATWKIVVIAAFSLAMKMWEDSARHWPLELSLGTDFSEAKICGAELLFCQIVDYRLHIDGEKYREYYTILFKPQFRR